MMFMSAYIPCSQDTAQTSPQPTKDSHKATGAVSEKLFPVPPYPFGFYGTDLLPHPLMVPDMFYPLPLSAAGLYPHLTPAMVRGASKLGSNTKEEKLNFGIDAILKKAEQKASKSSKSDEDKTHRDKKKEKDNNDCSSTSMNSPRHKEPSPEDLLNQHPLLAPHYPLPPLHPALTSPYMHTPPHSIHNVFERRGDHTNRPQCNSNPPKRKRSWSRAVFSSLQRKGLEKRFEIQKYVTKPDRRQLAAVLGLTDAQVKVWFQNRRMKWRHMEEQKKKQQHEQNRQKQQQPQKHCPEVSGGHSQESQMEEHVHVTDSEIDSDPE